MFKLNENGAPKVVAGVPPDYFSATGQLWGNPIYDWDRLKSEGFHWWIERVRWTLQLVDIVRLDHFRGFVACWEVPGEDKTAERGRWVEAPGNELLSALTEELGQLPFIAEDLGFITTDVIALRDHFGFPGMRILQYAFGGIVAIKTSRTTIHATPSSTQAHTITTRSSVGLMAGSEWIRRATPNRSSVSGDSA